MPTAESSAVGICLPAERLRMYELEEENRARLPPDVAKTKDHGLTSTQDVAYTNDNTMARLHTETIPTSTLAATARVVDGFVTTQSDHSGISSSFTRAYTATGITRTATDGRGNTTTTHTDLAGRSISSTDAAGNTTATVYDEDFDQPSVVTNAQGKTSCYKYDLRGRKVAEWGTAIQPALFGYDNADNMTALTTFRADSGDITTDPSERTDGDTTTWAYHPAAGVELSKTYADNSQVVKTYDAFNRPATETNARGIVKTLSYDAATGQLTGISFSDDETPSQSFAYNILGQLTQVTDAAGTRTIAYNEYSEQQSDSLDSGAHTHLVTELRDSYGRSTGFTYARSGSTQFTTSVGYGEDGRIATAGFMHGGVNRQFSYGYLSGSNLLHTLTQPNGLTLTQSYEEHRDLLTGMQYHRGSTLVVERSYSYDTLGRPTNRSTARQGSVKNDTFTHNDRSELVSATLGTDAYSYSYDNIGNRKTAQEAAEEATAYDANNLNQYTAIQTGEEAAFVPTFDADGNQTKVKTSTGIWNVVYNAENRPVTFTSEDGATVVECTYDYMGRRHTRKITVNGSVTNYLRYIYRGYLQIAAINAVSGVFQWFILWDPTQPVATRPLGIRKDGTWYTYGWDLTKNICEVYGQHGYIRTNYSYSPYGEVTISGDVTQPIQWSSEYADSEIDLVYYNYRHYSPMEGRWIGRDLINETNHNNLFIYAGSSPSVYSDTFGLAWNSDKGKEALSLAVKMRHTKETLPNEHPCCNMIRQVADGDCITFAAGVIECGYRMSGDNDMASRIAAAHGNNFNGQTISSILSNDGWKLIVYARDIRRVVSSYPNYEDLPENSKFVSGAGIQGTLSTAINTGALYGVTVHGAAYNLRPFNIRNRSLNDNDPFTMPTEKFAFVAMANAYHTGILQGAYIYNYESDGDPIRKTSIREWVALYQAGQTGWFMLAPDSLTNLPIYNKKFSKIRNNRAPKIIFSQTNTPAYID